MERTTAGTCNRHTIRLFTHSQEVLSEPLSLRYPLALVERGTDPQQLREVLETLADREEQLLVSLTSATLYQDNWSNLLGQALARHLNLAQSQRDHLITALHEAQVNALVHGNLELQSGFTDAEGLFRHYERIQQRLAQPSYARRRVETACNWNNEHVQIAVSDQGSGFDLWYAQADEHQVSGRGLMLITQLSDHVVIDQDGRRILMQFRLDGAAPESSNRP